MLLNSSTRAARTPRQRGVGAIARFVEDRQPLPVHHHVFIAAPFAAVSAQPLLDLAGRGRGGIGGHIAGSPSVQGRPPRFQVGAVVEHLFKGNGGAVAPPAHFALEVRHLRDHLDGIIA